MLPRHTIDRRGAAALLLLSASLSACAHAPRAEVLSAAGRQDCRRAAEALARPRPPASGDQVRRVLTTPASWLVTGTAYATDFTFTVAGGVVAGTALCLPLIMLEGAVHGDGSTSGQCVAAVAEPIISTGGILGLGDGVAEATRAWRCPDHVGQVREVLAAAGCLDRRGDPGDRDLARAVLERYRGDAERFGCTPASEQEAIDAALERLAPTPAPPADAPVGPAPRDEAAPAQPTTSL